MTVDCSPLAGLPECRRSTNEGRPAHGERPYDFGRVGVFGWFTNSRPKGAALSSNQILSLRHHGNMLRDSDACSPTAHRRKVNNQGFRVCFCYKKLNLIINDSDFVMLGLDLLIYSSDIIR